MKDPFLASDPEASLVIRLMGGHSSNGVTFTKDQVLALGRLYGHRKDADFNEFMAAGAERNMFRHAKADGLRLMAVLASFCDPGEDPVKVLVRLMSSQGYDVGALAEWAETPSEEES